MSKAQMDLMGYFGFPSAANPEPSRVKVKKQSKRRSGASLQKTEAAAANDVGVASNTANDLCDANIGESQSGICGAQEEERAGKRARVSLDSADLNERELVDDKLEEFSVDDLNGGDSAAAGVEDKTRLEFPDDEALEPDEKPKILTAAELKQQRLDQYWEKRRQNSRSVFSIHSAIYGQSKQLSSRQHEIRLLKGKGGPTNVLSQLFQRSIQPYSRKTRDMSSYIHSGQHWNTSATVQLDTHRISGEISAMSFDQEGVLLATGDDRGFVRIYDFDDVNALDVKMRNERARLLAEAESECETKAFDDTDLEANDDTDKTRDYEKLHRLPQIQPALSKHVLSFRCTSYRITDLQWNPNNQDQLAVSFAQSPEIHLYNVASSKTPLPRVIIGSASDNSSTKGREGISVMRFLTSAKKKPTQILTGGSRGTVRLWLVPVMKKGQAMKDISARCIWSVDISESNGEGCSDMLVLPSANKCMTDKSLVLLSGQAGSLVLLNTAKCTRKSFSTTVTPTIQSTWDLYNLTARELTKLGDTVKLPAKRWMGINKMSLLGCNCTNDKSSYRIILVLNCGWVLAVNLNVTQTMSPTNIITSSQNFAYNTSVRVQIIHQTPRIQCFNSMDEEVTVLGGMALNCSLPDIPTPSSLPVNNLKPMVWLGDVKPKKYTMPSKDKFVLCEQHGTVTSKDASSSKQKEHRQPGEGLILLDVSPRANKPIRRNSSQESSSENSNSPSQYQSEMRRVLARLPLSNDTPLSMAMHPAGEWIVVGYGSNRRSAAMKTLEIACMRKI